MSRRQKRDGKQAEVGGQEIQEVWMGARGGNDGVGGADTRLETSKIQIKQTNRWMCHISIQRQQKGRHASGPGEGVGRDQG